MTRATPSLVRRQGELVCLPLGGALIAIDVRPWAHPAVTHQPHDDGCGYCALSGRQQTTLCASACGRPRTAARRCAADRTLRDASRGRRRSSTSERPAPSTTAAPTLSQVTPAPPRSNPRLSIAAVQHVQFPTATLEPAPLHRCCSARAFPNHTRSHANRMFHMLHRTTCCCVRGHDGSCPGHGGAPRRSQFDAGEQHARVASPPVREPLADFLHIQQPRRAPPLSKHQTLAIGKS